MIVNTKTRGIQVYDVKLIKFDRGHLIRIKTVEKNPNLISHSAEIFPYSYKLVLLCLDKFNPFKGPTQIEISDDVDFGAVRILPFEVGYWMIHILLFEDFSIDVGECVPLRENPMIFP